MKTTSQSKTPQAASPTTSHHAHALLPVSLYIKIFSVLFVMIFISIAVAKLFAFSALTTLILLFVVAVIQAGLVAVFFMELVHEDRFYSLVFGSGILFILLFMVVTLLELHGRDFFETVEGIKYMRGVEQDNNFSPAFKHPGAQSSGEEH